MTVPHNCAITCRSGKVGYATVKSARTALNDCKKNRRFIKNRREKSFYSCEKCSQFHITSVPPGEGRFT